MSKIEEIVAEIRAISARVNDGSADSVLAGQSQGLSLAAAILEKKGAALDGEWQSERPSPGLWWVAIAPDRRSDLSFWSGTDPIKDVWVAKSGEVFQGNMSLSNELLTGALWQRRTVPGDPFKGGE